MVILSIKDTSILRIIIDFKNIPEQYELNIISEFDKSPKGDRGKVFNYFVAKRLRVLIENIQEY